MMAEAEGLTLVGVGFLLGLRHALDADHLAAVSTVLAERPSMLASGAVGLWWGMGHTVTLLLIGSIVLSAGFHIPEGFESLAESGVALLLIVLGGSLAVKICRERWHVHGHHHDGAQHVHFHSHQQGAEHHHRHWMVDSIRPFGIGMVHGLAGSAAVLLMILTATHDVGIGLLSIVLFGAGSMLGMISIGVVISVPVILSRSISHQLFMAVQGVASVASVVIGVWMLVKLVT